jgi:hypothetical protein
LSAAASYDAPSVSSAGVSNVASSGAMSVSVSGRGMGAGGPSAGGRVGGSACAASVWRSDSGLVCRVASGLLVLGSPVVVSSWLQFGSFSRAFSYVKGVLDAKVITVLSSSGSVLIPLSGISFASTCPGARIMSSSTVQSLWISDSSLRLKYAAGLSCSTSIFVSVGVFILGSVSELFSFAAPRILKIVVTKKPPSTGSSIFAITSTSLGLADYSPSIKIGSTLFTSTSSPKSAWVSSSSLNTKFSSGTTKKQQVPTEISGGVVSVSIACFSGSFSRSWTYVEAAIAIVAYSYPPLTGASVSIMLGRFFASFDTSVKTKIGASSTCSSAWISDSTSFSKISTGLGPRLSLLVSADVSYQRMNVYTFQPIELQAIENNLTSKATTSCTIMNLFAANLANVDGTSRFYFGASSAQVSIWSSDSSVFCHLPHGFRFRSRITATLGGFRSFSANMISNNFNITQSHESRLPTTGCLHIAINAFNFGIFESSIKSRIGFSSLLSTKWYSDSWMLLKVSTGEGKNNSLKLSFIPSSQSYSSILMCYVNALISSASINMPASGALLVSIGGTSFGLWGDSKVVRVGKTSVLSSHWISESHILCKMAAFTETQVSIFALSFGQFSAVGNAFTMQRTTSRIRLADVVFPLTGSKFLFLFGMFAPHSRSPFASLGISSTMSSIWVSDSSIAIKHAGGSGHVVMAKISLIDRYVISTHIVAEFQAPLVSILSPSNAPTTGQSFISLYGKNFGNFGYSESVSFEEVPNLTTKWISDSAMTSLHPVGYASPATVTVSVSRLTGMFKDIFSYDFFSFSTRDADTATNITSFLIASSGSQMLTFKGLDFGGVNPSAKVSNGDTGCEFSHWVSDTILTAKLSRAAASAGPRSIRVSVDLGWSAFSYLQKELYEPVFIAKSLFGLVSPNTGSLFHFVGQNIRASDHSFRIRIMSTAVTESQWISDSSIKGKFSASSCNEKSSALVISAFMQSLYPNSSVFCDIFFKVEQLQPFVTTGVALSTILGSRFSGMDKTLKMRIGLSSALSTQWSSDSSLIIKLPIVAGIVLSVHVSSESVSIQGAGNLSAPSFVYYYSPSSIPITGSVDVFFDGRSFGAFESSLIVYSRNREFQNCRWTSDSAISGIAPPGMYRAPLKIQISEQVSSIDNVFLSYKPLPIMNHLGNFVDFPLLLHQHIGNEGSSNLQTNQNFSFQTANVPNLQPGHKRIGQLHTSVLLKVCFKNLENSTLIQFSSSDGKQFGLKLGVAGLFLFFGNFSESYMFQVEREAYHLIVFRFDGEIIHICVDGTTVARSITTNFQDDFDLEHIFVICREVMSIDAKSCTMLLFAMPIGDRDMDSIATWIGKKSPKYPHQWDAITASTIVSIIPSQHDFEGSKVVTISARRLSEDTSNIQFYVAGYRCNIKDIDLVAQVFSCTLPEFYGYATAELHVDGMATYLHNAIKTNDPVINFILQSPIMEGKIKITLFGINFGTTQSTQGSLIPKFGGTGLIPRELVSVISQNNRMLEFIMQIDVNKYPVMKDSVVSVEINMLQSNFASMMIPAEDDPCRRQVSHRNCLDCCLRKCMHRLARKADVQQCEKGCSEECTFFGTECSSLDDVLIAQTKNGDCVNISWHSHPENLFKCSYEVRFSASDKMYQSLTNKSYVIFCGFLQYDLLQDIKIATLNQMSQIESWSKPQSFRIFHITAPSEVLNLIIKELHGMIQASWDPPMNNGASSILKYNVILSPSDVFVDCCFFAIEKSTFQDNAICVQVAAKNSAGQGENVRACLQSSEKNNDHLEIENIENFILLPGHSKVQEVPLVYDDIRGVRLTVDQNGNDVAFVSTLSPFKLDLIVTLSDNACGVYPVIIHARSSVDSMSQRNFNVIASNSWTNFAPGEFRASSRTTITIYGCFKGVLHSILNIHCTAGNMTVFSSRAHDNFHEFHIILWNHAACISSIYVSYKRGDDFISIPFNQKLHSSQSQPLLSIRADISSIEPLSLIPSIINLLTVTGAGFSNVRVDWGFSKYPDHGDVTVRMESVLFRTECETITTKLLLCDVPDWTSQFPAGLSSLIFYDLYSGLEILINAGTHARVEILPHMTRFTPSVANAIGGSLVTLEGLGFDSTKTYILQNVDIQQKNIVFKLIRSSIFALTFEVPKWPAGAVKRTEFQLQDDAGYDVLNQKIEFDFISNILKLFPTLALCIQSNVQLITLSGLGFSAEPNYTATFSSSKQTQFSGYSMNSSCVYKNSKTILCHPVDWCLLNSAALLSVRLLANLNAEVYITHSMVNMLIQFVPQIIRIQPNPLSSSGSGVLFIIGKGFPLNFSALFCTYQFGNVILNSTAFFCNATMIGCNVPSWGSKFPAQSALISFFSEDSAAPPPASYAVDFVSSVSSIHPSLQTIYGGTILFVEGSGFNGNAPDFKCVFLQGTFKSMTPFSVLNSGSGSCPTPFWSAENLENRTYEVKLVYGLNAKAMDAGVIMLA